MRGFICHAMSLHLLSIPSIPRQNICKNISNVDRYRHLYLQMCREMRGKCKFYMVLNSYKINDVEKMFLNKYRYQLAISTNIQKDFTQESPGKLF